jgi:hypothetical protein
LCAKRGGTHLRKNFKIVAAVLTGTLLKQHTKRKKDYGCDSEQRTSLAANKLKNSAVKVSKSEKKLKMAFLKYCSSLCFVLMLLFGHGLCQDRGQIDRSVIDIIRESRDLTEVSQPIMKNQFMKYFLDVEGLSISCPISILRA